MRPMWSISPCVNTKGSRLSARSRLSRAALQESLRELQKAAERVKAVGLRGFFSILFVPGRKAGVDQDLLARRHVEEVALDADNAAVLMNLKEAVVKNRAEA